MNSEILFDAARMPPRDADGYVWHPDLDERFQHDEWEEYVDLKKFHAVGFQMTTVAFEYDATEEMLKLYYEDGEPGCNSWTPTVPDGEGWQLIAVYDSEDGPHAMFVRSILRGKA